MSKKKDKNLKKKDLVKKEYIFTIVPIIFIVCFIPLIVGLKVVNLSGDLLKYWTGPDKYADFYSYNKMLWFLIATIAAVIVMLFLMYKKRLQFKKTYLYIPMAVYSLFVILSTLLSKSRQISTMGFVGRYEGIFVLLAYMIIMILTINLVNDERHIKYVIYTLMGSALIIGIIGLFQYFGLDIFQTDFGKRIILPGKYEALKSSIDFKVTAHSIYSTLNHYNYVGSYMAMLFPLSFVLFLIQKDKKIKIAAGLFSLLMLANWIACRSRAGLVGGVFAILMIIIILRKQIFKNWKISVGCFIAIIVILLGLNKVSDGSLLNKITSLYNDPELGTQNNALKDIVIDKNTVNIITSSSNISISYDQYQLLFKDDKGNVIPTASDKGKITLMDDRYKAIQVLVGVNNNLQVLQLDAGSYKVNFALTTEGFKIFNYRGEPVDLKPVQTWGFKGRESLGSARGYIWSRSIPLLKDAVIVGYGPDTFAMKFPQNDSVGKIKAYNTVNIIVDKPHNLYLQIALNTGIISLLSILVLFIGYFISSIKIFFNNQFSDFYSKAGFAIFAAVCGYLGAAFFNDSAITVAPVFWILLGVGISINLRIRKDKSYL